MKFLSLITFFIYFRRKGFIIRLTPLARRLLIVTLFGLNLVLGYLAMLVAMTYSIELFLCVVLGLCIGHFIFNTKTIVGESIDPCCASQQQANAVTNQNGASNHMALSRTPCDPEIHMDSDHEELCGSSDSSDHCASNGISHVTTPTTVVFSNQCESSNNCNKSQGIADGTSNEKPSSPPPYSLT